MSTSHGAVPRPNSHRTGKTCVVKHWLPENYLKTISKHQIVGSLGPMRWLMEVKEALITSNFIPLCHVMPDTSDTGHGPFPQSCVIIFFMFPAFSPIWLGLQSPTPASEDRNKTSPVLQVSVASASGQPEGLQSPPSFCWA